MLEGVAFGLRDSLDLLRGLGVEADAAGSPAAAPAPDRGSRIVASVLGLPLETTAAEEGSAYGAALLGGVAGGVFDDVHEAVARCVRVGRDDRARRCLDVAPTTSSTRGTARSTPPSSPGGDDETTTVTTRIGLLSTANINREILAGAAVSDAVEVVAVGSRDRATGRGVRGRARASRARTARYEELLADDGVDAVYISLPNGMHHEWTMHALAAGQARALREAVLPPAPPTSRRPSTRPSAAGSC